MAIIVNIDVMLAKRKISSKDLAEKIGITAQNFSVLKTGKAKAIRFETLEIICEALDCQPGDILEFQKDNYDYKYDYKESKKDIPLKSAKVYLPE